MGPKTATANAIQPDGGHVELFIRFVPPGSRDALKTEVGACFAFIRLKNLENKMNTKMYVGNLPFDAAENDLRGLFSNYGNVTDIHMPFDQASGRPRGFAFITMDTPEGMQEAMKQLDNQPFMGRPLTVNEARPMGERPAYGGGGGGGGRGGPRGGGGGGGGNRGGGRRY